MKPKIKILDIRKYVVVPATNGWIIAAHDQRSGDEIQVVCKTAKEVAAFFSKLDEGRARAIKALSNDA